MIVNNNVTINVGINANKALPQMTSNGELFHLAMASSGNPKYNLINGITVTIIAITPTNNNPQ